jgi:hypothetical protein
MDVFIDSMVLFMVSQAVSIEPASAAIEAARAMDAILPEPALDGWSRLVMDAGDIKSS